MTVINTNVKALVAQGAMATNSRSLSKAMEQLSTGKQINSAADDAAGFAISNQMTSQIRGLNMAVKNANDAVSLLQTAEGAMVEVNEMMQRMREIAVQSSSSTNNDEDRAYLQLEFAALSEEITRVRDTTEFNGMSLLNGDGDFTFQIGANGSQTMSVSIDDIAGATAGGRDVDATITAADSNTSGQISVFDIAAEDASTAFEEGDKIFLKVADVSFVYTITADDVTDFAATNNDDGVGDAVSVKLASMINSDSRMQGKYFAEATNDGTSTLTITGVDLDNAYTATMSISAVTDIAPSTTAAGLGTYGQITTLDFGAENTTTEYEAGDVITLQVADTTFKYTITAADVLDFAETNNDDGVGDAVSVKLAAMINSTASLQGVVLAEASNDGTSVLTLTGIDLDDSFTVTATSRGGSATGPVGDISTQSGANSAIDDLTAAIQTLDAQRANLGAGINRLTHTMNNLTNISTNTEASRSRIEDTDYAKASAELARTQIIQQAATAMLAQANQQSASVLSLLQ